MQQCQALAANGDGLRPGFTLLVGPPYLATEVRGRRKSSGIFMRIYTSANTQPGLPLKPGKCATMTHDYKRNGTTTLFAALNVLDGTVLARCTTAARRAAGSRM